MSFLGGYFYVRKDNLILPKKHQLQPHAFTGLSALGFNFL